MKTITIPKRFGYPTLDITINGETYTVKSGEEITVEDSVAEAIENAIKLEPKQGRYLSKFAQRVEGSIAEITTEDLEGVSTIGHSAFASCSNLRKVSMPNGITSIRLYAFSWCSNLVSVCLPETPPSLADANAFGNIKSTCIFYCKSRASLDAYRSAPIWSTLASTYSFVVEE